MTVTSAGAGRGTVFSVEMDLVSPSECTSKRRFPFMSRNASVIESGGEKEESSFFGESFYHNGASGRLGADISRIRPLPPTDNSNDAARNNRPFSLVRSGLTVVPPRRSTLDRIRSFSRAYSASPRSPAMDVERSVNRKASPHDENRARTALVAATETDLASAAGPDEVAYLCPESDLVTRHRQNKLRILIVDDAKSNRSILAKLLRKRAEVCDEACDGAEAVARVESATISRRPYDIILMDFVMPVMDGPTATKIIRSLGYVGLIIGVTGNALQADIDIFFGHGVDTVMIKPFNVIHFEEYLLSRLHL